MWYPSKFSSSLWGIFYRSPHHLVCLEKQWLLLRGGLLDSFSLWDMKKYIQETPYMEVSFDDERKNCRTTDATQKRASKDIREEFKTQINSFKHKKLLHLAGKESACDVGDQGSIPGFGRSLGEGNSNPLNHSCLENFMDRGAWQATVDEVAKSRTWMSN